MGAAIYVRQSLDRHGDSLAVTRQEVECQALAAAHGWEVTEVYSDNDVSASSTKARPEWTRLLADLAAGRHDTLVCWHTDRLYRRLRDLVDLVDIAEKRALRIVTCRAGDIDLSTPAGRMLAGMLGSAGRYEIEQKTARQVAANRARAGRGVSLWTRRPFGFDRDGHTVRLVENEAEEIRAAALAVLGGATLTSVRDDLNTRGVPTSTGATWSVTSVRRALVNPRNVGRVVYCGADMGTGEGPVVLDPETFERLTAMLTDPRRKTAPSTQVKHLLSGLVRCGACDVPMFATNTATRTAGKYSVYRCLTCKRTRRREYVDELVTGVVLARLAQPDALALLVADTDVSALRVHVTELRERRDGLAMLLADGLLSAESVRTQATRLGQQIGDTEREIDAGLGTSPLAPLLGAADVQDTWASLPILQQRAVIDALMTVHIEPAGKGVRFHPDQVRIQWRQA